MEPKAQRPPPPKPGQSSKATFLDEVCDVDDLFAPGPSTDSSAESHTMLSELQRYLSGEGAGAASYTDPLGWWKVCTMLGIFAPY